MRTIPLLIFGVITTALVVILNSTILLPAPLGKLLSPQNGLWQNADPVDMDYSADLTITQLKGKAEVYFDERLVPHVFAENDLDAFFVQGFLHAKFRLWQMEFQTHAAAGRLSEILGDRPGIIDFDRNKRRLGMVYAAEAALKEIENDPESLAQADSYTAGVNAYLETLSESSLPIEYKLLGYKPEKWTNLKTALFLKAMALDLAGYENDFEMSNAKAVFSAYDFDKLYPIVMDSLDPIVPKGTLFPAPGIQVSIPAKADSLYFNFKDSNNIDGEREKPDPNNGSNNWAVAGTKTKSGAPILCNDPHLGLNLPALWYEMQISTPSFNAYGATFPGAPSVIIGFNDNCAFGFTNAMRDVRDYFEVKFNDDSRSEYWFDSSWHTTTFRVELIKVKGHPDYKDSVAYTNIGPVMYDKTFSGGRATNDKNYAVRWKAHDPSNELKVFTLLNKAKNYNDYYAAVKYLHTPGQNAIFASKDGDIAIWDQGAFPAKWRRQGDFMMPGKDSSYFWQGVIPQVENPHQINPERGFVSSANQLPTDTTYPYYLGGSYPPYRGWEINKRLSDMENITPQEMMALQVDNYNVFAEMAVPVLLNNIDAEKLNGEQIKYLNLLKDWDFKNSPDSKGTTVFVVLWDSLENEVWKDELKKYRHKLPWPHESTLLDLINKDPGFSFFDNINTPEVETIQDDVMNAFIKTCKTLADVESKGKLAWAKFKDTRVQHLAQIPEFSRLHLPIGGGEHVINATKEQHGPSWRMVVSLTSEIEAYGIYPGGQSGNPGSKYYDDFVDQWVQGEYYKLWVMKPADKTDKRIKWKMIFNPA
ncbi:MAG: penicillin acylase family protein [Ginsengibacter sp.]